MAVRVGSVEIRATQRAEARDARSLASLRVPGQSGGVYQDLGREPVIVLVDGLLYGDQASSDVEALRAAFLSGEPQSFAADIALGTEITDVVVEDLRLWQVAGTADRYQASLQLREHNAPPEKPSLGFAAVLKDVLQDAQRWMKVASAVMRIARDPAKLWEELAKNPEIRQILHADEIEAYAVEAVSEVTGLTPEQVRDLAEELDPENVEGALELLRDGPSLLADLVAVGAAAGSLAAHLHPDALASAVGDAKQGPKVLQRTLGDLSGLADATSRLLRHTSLRAWVTKLARAMRLDADWNAGVTDVTKALIDFADALDSLVPMLEQLDALLALLQLVTPATGGLARATGAFTLQLAALGANAQGANTAAGALDQVQGALDTGLGWAEAVVRPRDVAALARRVRGLADDLGRQRVEGR